MDLWHILGNDIKEKIKPKYDLEITSYTYLKDLLINPELGKGFFKIDRSSDFSLLNDIHKDAFQSETYRDKEKVHNLGIL